MDIKKNTSCYIARLLELDSRHSKDNPNRHTELNKPLKCISICVQANNKRYRVHKPFIDYPLVFRMTSKNTRCRTIWAFCLWLQFVYGLTAHTLSRTHKENECIQLFPIWVDRLRCELWLRKRKCSTVFGVRRFNSSTHYNLELSV